MLDVLKTTLKEKGYSLTKPRMAVFSALQSGAARSMRELTLDLSSVINRASLYRAIKLYEELGIVVRVNQGWKYKVELSDAFTPHHHHLTCEKCKRSVSFEEPPGLEDTIDAVAATHGYAPKRHSLEVFGLCPQCRASA